MKNTNIIKKYFSLVVLTVFLLVPLLPTAVVAGPQESVGGLQPINNSADCDTNNARCCNGVAISIGVECPPSDNPILSYLAGIINFLALGVPVVVVAAIIVGGIQYITAGGVPQKLEAARKRIINALIALVTFIFLYAILRWLVPGDIF